MSVAAGKDAVERYWLASDSGYRLHHGLLTDEQYEHLAEDGSLNERVRMTCLIYLREPRMPNLYEQWGATRCISCCKKLKVEQGTRSPCRVEGSLVVNGVERAATGRTAALTAFIDKRKEHRHG